MFVEYSAPAPPAPKGTKKRRGGPSEVRAHITKEFHRRLRVKRLDALKGINGPNEPEDSISIGANSFTLPERSRSASESSPDTEDQQGDDECSQYSISQKSDTTRSSLSSTSASPLSVDVALQSIPRRLQTLLGEGRIELFDFMPAQKHSLFIHKVFEHGRCPQYPDVHFGISWLPLHPHSHRSPSVFEQD